MRKEILNSLNLTLIGKYSPGNFYLGIDLTSDSLHLGHILLLIKAKRLSELLKSKCLILLGDFTSRIGDPTNRLSERPALNQHSISNNFRKITKQIKALCPNFLITINSLWWDRIKVGQFLKLMEKYSLNSKLKIDYYKRRIESGNRVSLAELSYSILQAYDHVYLSSKLGVKGQLAGNDQRNNIVASLNLTPKEKPLYGLLMPLILDSRGQKIGKTSGFEKGKPWFDNEKCDHCLFYSALEKINLPNEDKNSIMRARGFKGESLGELRDRVCLNDNINLIEILTLYFGVKNKSAARNLILSGNLNVNEKIVLDPKIKLGNEDEIRLGSKKLKCLRLFN